MKHLRFWRLRPSSCQPDIFHLFHLWKEWLFDWDCLKRVGKKRGGRALCEKKKHWPYERVRSHSRGKNWDYHVRYSALFQFFDIWVFILCLFFKINFALRHLFFLCCRHSLHSEWLTTLYGYTSKITAFKQEINWICSIIKSSSKQCYCSSTYWQWHLNANIYQFQIPGFCFLLETNQCCWCKETSWCISAMQ